MYETILQDFDIRMIMDSGQAFRIRELPDGSFLAASRGRSVRICQEGETVTFSCTEEEFKGFWWDYFDLGCDYGAIKRSIDPEDGYLTAAAAYSCGVRILRQDLWETIISFLVSQNNNIRRIRNSLEAICERFVDMGGTAGSDRCAQTADGTAEPDRCARTADGMAGPNRCARTTDGMAGTVRCAQAVDGCAGTDKRAQTPDVCASEAYTIPSFPTPEALCSRGLEGLQGLGLGYRDKYILKMAQRCCGSAGQQWLAQLQGSDYDTAVRILMQEFGIGRKVADCICLFSLHHVDAFPVDTHIRQILDRHYPDGFPFDRYQGYAGILQQYMFFYKLSGKV